MMKDRQSVRKFVIFPQVFVRGSLFFFLYYF